MLERARTWIETAPSAASAAVVSVAAFATVGGAWIFEALGVKPCPLCLTQRIPYYVTIPLAALVAVAAWRRLPRAVVLGGLGLLVVIMLFSAGFGVYHSGVEWRWWPGPTDCSGPLTGLGSAGSLMRQLETISVIRCDEAAWRLFGLSLAGYNALISLVLAAVAGWGIRGETAAAHGSSSVSQ